MEFWGVEVKAGKPFKVIPQEGKVIHISQAALGEVKRKGNESILLHVKIDGQKLVLGSLIIETIPQVSFDLVFHKEFELSHNWKNGDVYFCGYTGDSPSAEDSESDDESAEQLAPLSVNQNEVRPTEDKSKATKPEPSTKPKVTPIEPKKPVESSDDDDDEDMPGALDSNDDDSEDEDDLDNEDNSEDDEETPKPVTDKKRTNESATKTSVQAKKAKVDTPQKTGGKKGGHVATPHPSKQAGKPITANSSAIAQTPKSEGKVTCKSCSRTFNSENALQSHTKAKHSVA